MCTIWLCRLPGLAPAELRPLAHALRDQMLTAALGQTLRLERDPRGKPQLREPPGWHFSLSHSQDAVALALGRSPLGIDIEPRGRKARWAALARRQFHAEEVRQLEAQQTELIASTALALWTAKEAWAKATGLGVVSMAQAPQLLWGQGGWTLPPGHADHLQQFTAWDAFVVSLYILNRRPAPLSWKVMSAQREAKGWHFQSAPACPVAEFAA